ncbi:hypothetical protein ILUMI_08111 [Ignelater luminosus]|uniref:Uncharacterized protein n=1 Tax=Ignelater luminosus TaxID=2038154 RepID=A0A8K0D7I3_IGNLU|nr:hypothetical protein ILUMI_08111 [Ignelater luminosus]
MAIQYEMSEKGSSENVNVETAAPNNTTKDAQWFKTCSPQYLLLITMLGAAILASLITLTVLLTRFTPTHSTALNTNNETTESYLLPNGNSDEKRVVIPHDDEPQSLEDYSVEPTATLTKPKELKIVTRKEWLAQTPAEPLSPLKSPVPNVIIMHTATENCSDIEKCILYVRSIQSFHIDSRSWWDIGYNWLVGGDGYAYEGRGWTSEGANVYGYNAKSIAIAFIGAFNQIMPPERQITAAKQLIKIGVEKGYIAKDYKLLAARQLQATESPGLLLYEDMKKWPHWSSAP